MTAYKRISPLPVATDNHIGYMEKDPIRCNDSLETFEEILKIAKAEEVVNTSIFQSHRMHRLHF